MSRGSPQPWSSAAVAQPAEGFNLFDVVRVRHAVPDCGLQGGEQGTIIEILDRPQRGYLVDFSGGSADPASAKLPVFSLAAAQIDRIWRSQPRR